MEHHDLFKNWTINFSNCKKDEMSKENTRMFIGCCLIEKENTLKETAKELEKSFIFQVITKRSKYMNLDISIASKIFLSTLVNTPGDAVMYLSYLKSCQLDKKRKIDMTELSKLFPLGFLSNSELRKMWEMQKVGSQNMLDLIEFN